MYRSISRLRCAAVLALVLFGSWLTVPGAAMDEIPGLQAWYKTDSLHATLRDGDAVSSWPDSSGRRRDLTSYGNGSPSIFEVQQAAGHAVVRLGKGNSFSVAEPFEIDDHTIFLVYEAERPRMGLFDGVVENLESSGIILRQEGIRDVGQVGTVAAPYGRDAEAGAGLNLTVLGRDSGRLHAFLNGRDLSSGEELRGTLQVGRLFEMRQTRAVKLDGLGIRVAEMMFYDRFLSDDERREVTHHLSEKYAIDLVPEVGALLQTATRQEVRPGEGHWISWKRQVELHAPMMHEPHDGSEGSRLSCSRDGTRVRLSVTLAVSPSAPEAELRLLVLKNGTDYLPDEASSGPLIGPRATVELLATVTLNAGDYVEIVAFASNGVARVEPQGSKLRAEVLP